jgi:small subunit ribosomal protein S2
VPEKIVTASEEISVEDIPEYTQYVDPKYAEEIMAESFADEDLPSVSVRKGPASEVAPAAQQAPVASDSGD